MSFSSYYFPLFFIGYVALHYLLPASLRRVWLLLASCGFYMAAIPSYILILFGLILVDFTAALSLEPLEGRSRKLLLSVSVAANLGMLFVFKYFDFFGAEVGALLARFGILVNVQHLSLVLPIGLSFHTFQSLGYVFEVYYRRQTAERNLLTYSLYVLFWPQLVAGPIERSKSLMGQLRHLPPFASSAFTQGARWMLIGFIKKLVIADRLGNFVDLVYATPTKYAGAPLILATYCFAFQIYCDFSGYTDIARGAAKVLGIDLIKNFNFPYIAKSIPDFWNRWHISLSSWFRDYLYLPLGGSRRSPVRTCVNIMVVFLVSGLWHGANWTFVLWGALHGIYLVVWRLTSAARESISHHPLVASRPGLYRLVGAVLTFHLVAFAWIFFRANSVADAFYIATHLLSNSSGELGLGLGQWAFRGVLVGALLTAEFWMENNRLDGRLWRRREMRWAVYYAGILLILTTGIFAEAKFIYFQF